MFRSASVLLGQIEFRTAEGDAINIDRKVELYRWLRFAGLLLVGWCTKTTTHVFRRNWIWFVANFCMLANGCYIATAWISGDRFLDTPRLLDAGAWPLSILLYCAVTIGFGYFGFRSNCMELLLTTLSGSVSGAIAKRTQLLFGDPLPSISVTLAFD